MQHLALADAPKKIWSVSIGNGSSDRKQLTETPVVADGTLFAIDSNAKVSAFDAATGQKRWSYDIKVPKQSKGISFGGGVGYDKGKLYASTGYGVVVAFDATSGKELWRVSLGMPLRGAPAIADGRVFVNSFDNQLFALNAENGETIWDHPGIVESAGILGAATPAVGSGVVIAGFSSGELFALAVENGRPAWSDMLTRTGRLTPLSTLADIDASPIIDRGIVYGISQAGRMVAIDLRTGERVWERNVGSAHTPAVAGEYIYVVTNDNEIVCLSRQSGAVRWVTPLQKFKKPEDRKGRVFWGGPVLAGDRLIITSSHGWALSVSPYNGKILSGTKLEDKTYLSPIVANSTLYFLTDDGEITAYR
nr:PQQ-binding-like beta-propeller repeat protein [Govania unica]